MLVLLSPAKSLNWAPVDAKLPLSAPELGKETAALVKVMKKQKPAAIAELMKLSDKLAQLNHERFQAMSGKPDPSRDRPAALAFDGDVYKGLDARTLSEADLVWSQDHVAILSGLYGLLRPLDLIEEYRLEMGTRLATRRGASLYEFWGDRVTQAVRQRLDDGAGPIVNLASQEYSRVVDLKGLGAPVVTPVFQEESGGKHKVISFYAKRARGLMARFIVEKRIVKVRALQKFNVAGYAYEPDRSSEHTWVFARPKPPPAK